MRVTPIPDAIEKLTALGLCELKDGLYSAPEPQDLGYWLTWDNPAPKRWQDKVTYLKIYRVQSASGLTSRQNALFCKILNYPGKLPAYYATCLGLSRRTVFDQLKKLRSLGLITKDGCHVPESIPDLWVSKPAEQSVISPYMRKFFFDMQDGWLMPEVAIRKIELASEALASHLGHTPKYLRRYWTETFRALEAGNRITAFVQESGKITNHVIAKGKTRKYLKTTRDLVVKQLAACPLERAMFWSFDPTMLFKSL